MQYLNTKHISVAINTDAKYGELQTKIVELNAREVTMHDVVSIDTSTQDYNETNTNKPFTVTTITIKDSNNNMIDIACFLK